MDGISHILWANLLFPGDFWAIVLGSLIPDIFNGPNWLYRLITGKGTFWKTREDLIGLILGTDKYGDGWKYVNRGPLFNLVLFLNSIFALLIVWFLALKVNRGIINKHFAFSYTFHIFLDLFTHKNSEGWMPFYPFSNFQFNPGIVRWGMELKWYIVLNFVLLGILYFLKYKKVF